MSKSMNQSMPYPQGGQQSLAFNPVLEPIFTARQLEFNPT